MSPDVNIIICTYNRADSLAQTLAAISRVRVPDAMTVELLIVDNGSTDHTRLVVNQVAGLTPMHVRYTSEPDGGQARARNKGLAESNSRIILFTDDDIRPPADWVERMCNPIIAGDADLVVGGVRIAPDLDRPWLRGMVRTWFASTDHLSPGQPDLLGVGANMAFARGVLNKIPGFDERLGPGALGGADDTLFFLLARAAGMRIWPVLDCQVEHRFDERRLTRHGLLNCAAAYGRSAGYVQYHLDQVVHPWARLHSAKIGVCLLLKRLVRWPWRMSAGVPEWELVSILMRNLLDQYFSESRGLKRYCAVRFSESDGTTNFADGVRELNVADRVVAVTNEA